MEIKEPIVITPEQEVETETTNEDVLRTAKGESGNAEPIVRNAGGKRIVNTILVNEVKYLIAKAIEGILPKLGFKTVVVDELPAVGENGILYFVPNGGENPNAYDEYVWVVADSEFEKVGSTELPLNYVTTDTDQTITGIKTISNELKLGSSSIKVEVGGKIIEFKRDGESHFTMVNLRNRSITLEPMDANKYDLGEPTFIWRNLYLKGNISDGTNSVSVAGISNGLFNYINAEDIVNNTLTQEQYDLITNGKMTRIVGNLLGVDNIKILSVDDGVNDYKVCLILCGEYNPVNVRLLKINNSTRVVSLVASSGFSISWSDNLGRMFINNISIGHYYKKPQSSVSISDGGTITDSTLKTLIQNEQPIKLNGFTCYFSCDDGTNYQYVSTRYDSSANKNHINVITINKSTWVATFHTSDLALS